MNGQNKTKPKKTAKPFSLKRMLIIIWGIFIVGILCIFLLFWGTSHGLLGEMPDVADLENPDIYVSSEIYSADGVLLDRFETEKRIPITYNDLPEHVVNALLAREDIRYRKHSGIDPRSTLRAITSGGSSGGASTITQQLAKLLFTEKRSSNKIARVFQKIKEWVVAVELEKRYTKDEIMAMYLNKFDFVYSANGIELASKVYFNTTISKLTVDQGAMLIAMLKNPVWYNPVRNPKNALHERNVVLNQMEKYGFLTAEEAKTFKEKPIGLNKQEINTISESYSAYYK